MASGVAPPAQAGAYAIPGGAAVQSQTLSLDNDVTPGADSAHLPVTVAAVRPTIPSSKPFPSRHSDGRSPPDPQALSWTVPVPEPAGSSFHERVISLRRRYNRSVDHHSRNVEGISDAT
jgi:hypothetical protein